MTVPASRRAVACQRCGRSFGCDRAPKRCWCREQELAASTRARLAAAYGDCLCPACLAEVGRVGPALTVADPAA